MESNHYFILILSTTILSAFFSGMEIAFVSANKLRLELDKQLEPFSSKLLRVVTANSGKYIATMLIGNNVALVIYGIAFAGLLDPIFENYIHTESLILLITTVISTLVILVFGEFLPKTLFRTIPNTLLKIFLIPLSFFFFLFYPVTQFIVGITNILMKWLFKANIKQNNNNLVFSRIDLDEFVNEKDNNRSEKKRKY